MVVSDENQFKGFWLPFIFEETGTIDLLWRLLPTASMTYFIVTRFEDNLRALDSIYKNTTTIQHTFWEVNQMIGDCKPKTWK